MSVHTTYLLRGVKTCELSTAGGLDLLDEEGRSVVHVPNRVRVRVAGGPGSSWDMSPGQLERLVTVLSEAPGRNE